MKVLRSEIREVDKSRFWEKVDKGDGCWLWTAGTVRGYGMFGVHRKPIAAHRLSWIIAFGDIPDGILVCHKCDVRGCVRPDHLFLGTIADNIADCVAKGRNAKGDKHWTRTDPWKLPIGNEHWSRRMPELTAYGERNGQAKLTVEDVKAIRALSGKLSHKKISEQFHIGQAHATRIILRQRWAHVS